MPLGPKLVTGWMIVALVLTLASLLTRMTSGTGDVVRIVVQIALLTGLYTRQPAAWYAARWLAGLSIVVSVIFVALACFASNRTAGLVAYALATLAVVSGFFYLLGRSDSRAYFNARRKA
jgi:hypothetical protein